MLCCLNFIFLYCFARIAVAEGKVEKVLSIRSYIGVENLNIRTCALEGFKFFRSTKRKLNLPLEFEYDSHRPKNVNHPFIAQPRGQLGPTLRNRLNMMRMYCLTPPTC